LKTGGHFILPEQFLVGRLEGWATVESALGNLRKRATIRAEGYLDAATDTIAFTEHWKFDDRQTDTLSWRIRKTGDGKYVGYEPTVKDEAIGEQAGFAFHWRYTRDSPQGDGSSVALNFDDWFYRIDESVCIVRGSALQIGRTAHAYNAFCDAPGQGVLAVCLTGCVVIRGGDR
jgi:hypothetical protein